MKKYVVNTYERSEKGCLWPQRDDLSNACGDPDFKSLALQLLDVKSVTLLSGELINSETLSNKLPPSEKDDVTSKVQESMLNAI